MISFPPRPTILASYSQKISFFSTEQKLGSVYEKFQVILSDVMRSAVKAGLDDIDSELEKLRDILRSGQPKVNCTRCRSVADTCVTQLMSIEKAKLLPAEHGRPDLNTYLRSLREHYRARKEDEGVLAVAHGHLIRELGNVAAHGNSHTLTEFDSITALGATCRFAEFTVSRKVALSGSSAKSPEVAPNQIHFPPLQPQQPPQQPQMPPSVNAAVNAAAAVQMQQIMAQAAQQQQQMAQQGQRSQQWFPMAAGGAYMNPGMMPMMAQPQYYAAAPQPQQQASQPQQQQQQSLAQSKPQQKQQEAYVPSSIDSISNSDAQAFFAPRASVKAPSAAVGGSFAALVSQGDEEKYDESLLAPDEGKNSKPAAPAGKAALRSGPIGPEVRPSGAPIKPKPGARIPQGPPREPGDAAPARPGRRRNRKYRKAAQNGPQGQQTQVKEQNADEEEAGDEEEVDTNVELVRATHFKPPPSPQFFKWATHHYFLDSLFSLMNLCFLRPRRTIRIISPCAVSILIWSPI